MQQFAVRPGRVLGFKNAKTFDPQAAGEALAALQGDDGQGATPQAIVDAARDEGHTLHPHFEWDDSVAAEAHRRQTARHIASAVVVLEPSPQENPPPAFVSITTEAGRGYMPTREVAEAPDLRLQMLEAALRDIAAYRRRYEALLASCKEAGLGLGTTERALQALLEREQEAAKRRRKKGPDDDQPQPVA